MRIPVDEQDQLIDAQYTDRELWDHYEQLLTTPRFGYATLTTIEKLNLIRQHFSLLTQGRLPADLREYLGTDAMYDGNGHIRSDAWRISGISRIMLISRIRLMEYMDVQA